MVQGSGATIIFQNGERRTVQLFALLGPLAQRRLQAEDWKQLHVEYQSLSLKLIILRGQIWPANLDGVILALEYNWSGECSALIHQYTDLERLSEGPVKTEFTSANRRSNWLARLETSAQRIDTLVGQCESAEDLAARLAELTAELHRVERMCSELLTFLDSRLQRAIRELDKELEVVRASLAPSEK